MNNARILAAAGVAALALPGAALAKPPAGGPGEAHAHGGPAAHRHAPEGRHHGRGPAHRHTPTVALIARGTLVSVDAGAGTAVVHVVRANHHGHGLVGTDQPVDLSATRIVVADVNGDGSRDAGDLAAGDRVLLQGRVPLRGSVTGNLSVRRLVDQTRAKTDAGDGPDSPDDAPAS